MFLGTSFGRLPVAAFISVTEGLRAQLPLRNCAVYPDGLYVSKAFFLYAPLARATRAIYTSVIQTTCVTSRAHDREVEWSSTTV